MSTSPSPLILGAHMSIAGGMELALERGESIGCTSIQLFTKSNRQWFAPALGNEEIERFAQRLKQSPINRRHVIAHAGYLINVAAADAAIHKKSVQSLEHELERCHVLGIPYLVLHPGSYKGTDEAIAIQQLAQTLDRVFERVDGTTTILLETMAGQGSSLGSTLKQLADMYDKAHYKKRLGICVDTCHIFAAGYDIRTKDTYEHFWHSFDKTIGLNKLHAIHINDSKKGLGLRVDRHEDIGEGELGLEPFRLLFNDKRFVDIPKILETPETTDLMADYARNMSVIKKLVSR